MIVFRLTVEYEINIYFLNYILLFNRIELEELSFVVLQVAMKSN